MRSILPKIHPKFPLPPTWMFFFALRPPKKALVFFSLETNVGHLKEKMGAPKSGLNGDFLRDWQFSTDLSIKWALVEFLACRFLFRMVAKLREKER